MYCQITNKCNMHCAHCAFGCTSHGEDMPWEVFKAVVKEEKYFTIGGGEPTLHPQFEKFLLYAIANCESVWLATNGSQTDISLALAKMTKLGIISCVLSQDKWHDPIKPEVVKAFTKNKEILSYNNQMNDLREIRTVTNPIQSGRCTWGEAECPCEDLFIRPSGDIHWCGCINAPKLGNISTDYELKYQEREYEHGECWNK